MIWRSTREERPKDVSSRWGEKKLHSLVRSTETQTFVELVSAQPFHVRGQLDADTATPLGLDYRPIQHRGANSTGTQLGMDVYRLHLRDETASVAQLTDERELKCANDIAPQLGHIDTIIWVTLHGVKCLTETSVQRGACGLEWDVQLVIGKKVDNCREVAPASRPN